MASRILTIGLDGATFDIIHPLVAQGKLPILAGFLREGAWGELLSVVPPITPAAWVSFLTGKNPGQHGIFGFTERVESQFHDLKENLVSSHSIQANTLWEILGQKGKEVISINVPITYPAFPIRGILVSGLMAPNEESDFVYPLEVRNILFEKLGGYKVDDNPLQADIALDRRFWLWNYFDIEEKRHRSALYFLRNHPWDVFGIVYSLPDRIQHLTWQFQKDPGEGNQDLAQAITRAYQRMDEMVGELCQTAGPETTVVILSDHGFGPLEKVFYVNKWLYEAGYLKLSWPTLVQVLKTLRWEKRSPTFEKILAKLHLGGLNRKLPPDLLGRKVGYVRPAFRPPRPEIDWNRTRAFGANHGIYVNSSQDAERQSLRRELEQRLWELRDPEDGGEVTDTIVKREDIYSGAFAERGPDLVFRLRGMRYLQNDAFTRGEVFTPRRVGTHRMEGVFLAKGPGIDRGKGISGACIVDVAPTVLHLLGLPVPEDMDGKVLVDALTPGYVEENPIRFEPPLPFGGRGRSDEVFSAAEEEKVRAGLRALGYIE